MESEKDVAKKSEHQIAKEYSARSSLETAVLVILSSIGENSNYDS